MTVDNTLVLVYIVVYIVMHIVVHIEHDNV